MGIHCLVSYRNSPFPFSFTKLCDNRVRVLTEAYEDLAEESLWLDIFTLDSAPDDDRKWSAFGERRTFYKLSLSLRREKVPAGNHGQ